MKEKLLVSACLLGIPCRYDGKSKPINEAFCLRNKFELIPVCPEVLGDLKTPRSPCEIRNGRVIREDGLDLTDQFRKGAESVLLTAKREGCKQALLKEKSPSCGTHFCYDGSFSGKVVEGEGVTARLLRENGIRLYSENEIDLLLQKKC